MSMDAGASLKSADRMVLQGIAVREELARVIGSAVFRDSPRLSQFLTFVVETALAGNSEQIKAYTVAVDALGRGMDFDPQHDPIVRVQAGRLRNALGRYYAGAGSGDPLRIELPCGTYVPVFHKRRPDSGKPPPVSRRLAPANDPVGETTRQITMLQERLDALQDELAEARRALRISLVPFAASGARRRH